MNFSVWKSARVLFLVLISAFTLNTVSVDSALAGSKGGQFPQGPDLSLTPGELCNHPDTYRYPEHVPYCNRDVKGDLKREIIRMYDQQLGYSIESMDRQEFKIDHFIPLCAGGGNDVSNLWPQHRSIYTITDPMEPLICQRMSEGKLKQRDAIDMIKEGKTDLSKVDAILARLNAM